MVLGGYLVLHEKQILVAKLFFILLKVREKILYKSASKRGKRVLEAQTVM